MENEKEIVEPVEEVEAEEVSEEADADMPEEETVESAE